MTLRAIILAVFAGFFVAAFVTAILGRWMMLAYEAYRLAALGAPLNHIRRAIVMVLCQSLFHDAPWTLLTLIFVTFHIRHEPWVHWALGGFGVAFGYMMLVASVAGFRLLKRAKEGAVHAA